MNALMGSSVVLTFHYHLLWLPFAQSTHSVGSDALEGISGSGMAGLTLILVAVHFASASLADYIAVEEEECA